MIQKSFSRLTPPNLTRLLHNTAGYAGYFTEVSVRFGGSLFSVTTYMKAVNTQSRTLRSSRDRFRLEEPNFNMKTYGQRGFSVVAPPPTMEQLPL